MNKTKLEKGITLIALIITVVVLLIIAVVTIGSIRDSKIIDHAQNAATDYKEAQEKEQIGLGYSEYRLSSIKNPNSELEVEGATVIESKINDGWTVIFESGNTYELGKDGKVKENKPVVNPDPDGWDIAFMHDGTSWVDTRVTSEQGLEGAKIVAKFYKKTLDAPITPGDIILDPSNPITFDEITEGYTLYIEGTGDMGIVADFTGSNDANLPTIAYGYQSVLNGLLGRPSTETELLIAHVTEIVVCDGITSIGEGAFAGSTALQKLTIASTVKSIGDSAFVLSNINDIVIPGNITKIGDFAFESSQAKNLIIEEGVEEIGRRTFRDCTNIERIQLPNSLIKMGNSAFYNNSKLKNIVIPKNVTTINSTAFQKCNLLENVYIESEKTDFSVGENAFDVTSNLTIHVRNAEIATALSGRVGANTTISTDYNWTAPAI